MKFNGSAFDYYKQSENVLKNKTKFFDDTEFLDLLEITSEFGFKELNSSMKRDLLNFFKKREYHRIFKNPLDEMWTKDEAKFFERCKGILKPAHWKCSDGWTKITTQNGICYTFNMLRRSSLLNENM